MGSDINDWLVLKSPATRSKQQQLSQQQHQLQMINYQTRLVKTVQRNFYINDFLKSVRTPQEVTETYQNQKQP